ncbi:hypothetical protein BEWA_045870 [Theileria equi strain WA]|uniref:Signal peptide containing protein n=1 Tax=Theileria equi strain WA TaxID=1537102 RepID=L1LAC1_THEEQ|nr:hypothetical protein BEWA_045870 [Theileria equi strain WA]EKX72123.1 hypothetical protein BEWA_045870 [Theileria equi strain WA]|eukprot:XP_004831575.1 hypothetical protein BEWA_045870 [Theileria equi strain WA]
MMKAFIIPYALFLVGLCYGGDDLQAQNSLGTAELKEGQSEEPTFQSETSQSLGFQHGLDEPDSGIDTNLYSGESHSRDVGSGSVIPSAPEEPFEGFTDSAEVIPSAPEEPSGPQLPVQGIKKEGSSPVLGTPVAISEARPTSDRYPVADYKSKVDSTLFDVRESNNNGPFYLICTPKPNTVVTKLVYGGDTIWDGGNSFLSSALMYFKGDKPYVVTLQYREKEKNYTLFLHYDGKKWEHNKEEHANKLKTLKRRPPVTESYEKSLLTTLWSKGDSTLLNLALQQPPSTEWYLEKINENWNDVRGKMFEEEFRILKRELKHAIPITLDLANPNKSQITVETGNYSGVEYKGYTPKKGHYFSSFSNDGSPIWTISRGERCFLAQSFTNESLALFTLVSDFGRKYFEKAGGIWKSLNRGDFFNKLDRMERPEVPCEKLALLASKVDSTLFTVLDSFECNVKILKLTPKDGQAVTHVTYDEKEVWSGQGTFSTFSCSSATLYFDGVIPSLAVINTKSTGKQGKVYRYHDGKKWKNGNESSHKSKLEALKEKCRPITPVTLDIAKPDESKISVHDKDDNGVTVKEYAPKSCSKVTSVVDGEDTHIWTGVGEQFCTHALLSSNKYLKVLKVSVDDCGRTYDKFFEEFLGSWNELTNKAANKRLGVMREESILSLCTLDLSNPQVSNIDVKVVDECGIKYKEYYPRDGYKIISVVDHETTVWEAEASEQCTFVKSQEGNSVIINLNIHNAYGLRSRFFVRENGEWSETNMDRFDGKVAEMVIEHIEDPATYKSDEFLSPFLDKVDTSIFDLRELNEDYVKTLKLKAKEGVSVNMLGFDGELVWEDNKKSCLSAVLYMDGEKPTLAVLVTRDKNSKQGKVYRYHDGKKWKNSNEETYKEKLEELKKKYKPSAPCILDLTCLDRSKVDVNTETGSGALLKTVVPKDGHHVSSVVDSGATVWEATGDDQKCVGAQYFTRGESILLAIDIYDAHKVQKKYFNKIGGNWRSIDLDAFNWRAMRMHAGYEPILVTLDLPNPDESMIRTVDSVDGEVKYKRYFPNGGQSIESVTYLGEQLWKASEGGDECKYVTLATKEDSALLGLWFDNGMSVEVKGFKRVNKSWVELSRSEYFETVIEMRETTLEPEKLEEPVSSLASKVDASLFNASIYKYNGVYCLTCTPKEKKNPTKLVYEKDTIWSGNKSILFLSALIHFKGDKPYVVTLQYKENGKEETLCLHYNGCKWEDNRREHERKLEILRGYQHIPITLDLAKPDRSKVDIQTKNYRGVILKECSLKKEYYVDFIVDSGVIVWTPVKYEKCIFLESFMKGDSILLTILLKDDNGYTDKYFEKVDETWKNLEHDDFFKKLDKMRGFSSQPGAPY